MVAHVSCEHDDVNIDKWCWHWYLDLPHRGKIMVLKLLFPQDGIKPPPPLFSNNGQALEIRRTPLFSSNSCKKPPRFVANGFFFRKCKHPVTYVGPQLLFSSAQTLKGLFCCPCNKCLTIRSNPNNPQIWTKPLSNIWIGSKHKGGFFF